MPRQQTLVETGEPGWNSFIFNGILVTHETRHGHLVHQRHKLTPGSYLLTAAVGGGTKTSLFQMKR